MKNIKKVQKKTMMKNKKTLSFFNAIAGQYTWTLLQQALCVRSRVSLLVWIHDVILAMVSVLCGFEIFL